MAAIVSEQKAFGTTRASILAALETNWAASRLALFGESCQELVPWGFVGVFDSSRLDILTEQSTGPIVAVYPASGLLRAARRATGAPAYGPLTRTSDWVVDIRLHDFTLDPASYFTLEDAGREGELVQEMENMNAIVIDIIRKQLGKDNVTMLQGLNQENIYMASAPGQYGVILSARTLWTFTQETQSSFNN